MCRLCPSQGALLRGGRLAGAAIAEHFRFLMCAPMVSNGHRLGVLCLGSAAPRRADASCALVAAKLAELLRRELEASRAEARRSDALALLRSVDAHAEAIMFVSARPGQGAWRILHLNKPASAVSGSASSAVHVPVPCPHCGDARGSGRLAHHAIERARIACQQEAP